jgi:hypothetical protein
MQGLRTLEHWLDVEEMGGHTGCGCRCSLGLCWSMLALGEPKPQHRSGADLERGLLDAGPPVKANIGIFCMQGATRPDLVGYDRIPKRSIRLPFSRKPIHFVALVPRSWLRLEDANEASDTHLVNGLLRDHYGIDIVTSVCVIVPGRLRSVLLLTRAG